jgi:hypothetical protein
MTGNSDQEKVSMALQVSRKGDQIGAARRARARDGGLGQAGQRPQGRLQVAGRLARGLRRRRVELVTQRETAAARRDHHLLHAIDLGFAFRRQSPPRATRLVDVMYSCVVPPVGSRFKTNLNVPFVSPSVTNWTHPLFRVRGLNAG